MSTSGNWGGKRPGSGRKAGEPTMVIRVPTRLADAVRALCNGNQECSENQAADNGMVAKLQARNLELHDEVAKYRRLFADEKSFLGTAQDRIKALNAELAELHAENNALREQNEALLMSALDSAATDNPPDTMPE